MEWNEVRGASVVKPNLLRGGGAAVGTLNIPLDLDHRIYMCVCVCVCAWRKAKLGNIYNQKTKEVTRRERRQF